MSDRILNAAAWKEFAAAHGLRPEPLFKALALAAKVEAGELRAEVDAMERVADEIAVLRKAGPASRPVALHLDQMQAIADKHRQAAADALADQLAKRKAEERPLPAAMGTKLLPLMRELRRGAVMNALVASSGRMTAFLLSRKTIAPTQKKLLRIYLGAPSGIKFFAGECRFDERVLTFVLAGQVQGMQKRLKVAVFKQLQQRCNVEVQGDILG